MFFNFQKYANTEAKMIHSQKSGVICVLGSGNRSFSMQVILFLMSSDSG